MGRKPDEHILIVSDANLKGVGSVSHSKKRNFDSHSFGLRFLTASEAVISTNELDLLAVVYCIENFFIYVYDKKFKLVSDHTAIASVLKSEGRKNIRELTD